MAPMRILHVITELEVGGAEAVLYRLIQETLDEVEAVRVVAVRGGGRFAEMISDLGVRVDTLNLGRGPKQARAVSSMRSVMMEFQPSLVQTWLYHSDLLGGLASRIAGVPVIWGIHTGVPPPGPRALMFHTALPVFGFLSRVIPTHIICCSHESYSVHSRFGYARKKMTTIPNGFQIPVLDRTRARECLFRELNLPPDASVVVRVGRCHPQKDYPTMLASFRKVVEREPSAHLVLMGTGVSAQGEMFQQVREDPKLRRSVHLLDDRSDALELVAGADVSVSSSRFGEGLPLVMGEAMAVGVPVVATDVGDSRFLVDDAERLVPPAHPEELAKAIVRVLQLSDSERRNLGDRDRDRIMRFYSVEAMARQYMNTYNEVLRRVHR